MCRLRYSLDMRLISLVKTPPVSDEGRTGSNHWAGACHQCAGALQYFL